MTAHFDDLEVGQVLSLGVAPVDGRGLDIFCRTFVPTWTPEMGAPESYLYALWSKMDAEASTQWAQTKRLAVDALRWSRSPPAGELMRGRMTVLGKDPVGDDKGLIIAQHDLLDEAGRLVFSCLTRSVFARR